MMVQGSSRRSTQAQIVLAVSAWPGGIYNTFEDTLPIIYVAWQQSSDGIHYALTSPKIGRDTTD